MMNIIPILNFILLLTIHISNSGETEPTPTKKESELYKDVKQILPPSNETDYQQLANRMTDEDIIKETQTLFRIKAIVKQSLNDFLFNIKQTNGKIDHTYTNDIEEINTLMESFTNKTTNYFVKAEKTLQKLLKKHKHYSKTKKFIQNHSLYFKKKTFRFCEKIEKKFDKSIKHIQFLGKVGIKQNLQLFKEVSSNFSDISLVIKEELTFEYLRNVTIEMKIIKNKCKIAIETYVQNYVSHIETLKVDEIKFINDFVEMKILLLKIRGDKRKFVEDKNLVKNDTRLLLDSKEKDFLANIKKINNNAFEIITNATNKLMANYDFELPKPEPNGL
uniref:Uncharacterized protein n=1 Tax=Clastoptera arizonana TaxID=38151 RepID=A0A1B6D7T5_9HEMI